MKKQGITRSQRDPRLRRGAAAVVATVLGLAAACALAADAGRSGAKSIDYAGLCEASAAVALDKQHFAVADDESNALRIYRDGTREPVRPPLDLGPFLHTGDKASDLEAAARVGDTVYWLSSHSRTSKGKEREWRQRFFATHVVAGTSAGSPPQLQPQGQPYTGLLADLLDSPLTAPLGLKEAAERRPEADGGFNIEGLAAAPDGSLLIGFRNPLVKGRAIVLPLRNPAALVAGGGARASFGEPVLLALGGRGIRSIDAVDGGYLIVAGPIADAGRFALFRWGGRASDAPVELTVVLARSLSPEAAVVFDPKAREAMLLSDDGARCVLSAQKFRAARVKF